MSVSDCFDFEVQDIDRTVSFLESMKQSLIDLHVHSNFSDGDQSPLELIRLAKEANVSILSIADHDTILGILVCANRRERSHLFDAMVFDADWKEHPEYVSSKYPLLKYFHRPVSFTDMLQAVKKLADPFEFVRVDFYEVDGYPIFGEMTFTPDMSGALSTLYKNLLFNKIFPTLKSIK